MFNIVKIIGVSVSFLLFAGFSILLILLVVGKSDLLLRVIALRVIAGYEDWIKDSSILVMLTITSIVSVLCSRIVVFGICSGILKNQRELGTRMFWSVFAAFLALQIVGIYLLRSAD